MGWGFESAIGFPFISSQIRQHFRLYQVRQQAQQSEYVFCSPSFSYSQYSLLSRSEIKNNGGTMRAINGHFSAIISNFINPYHKLRGPYYELLNSMASEEEKEKIASNESVSQKKKDEGQDFVLQCFCIAFSTAVAKTITHPLALISTWQTVQESGQLNIPFNWPWFMVSDFCEGVSSAYSEIKSSKKSVYDGLFISVFSSTCFEVTKYCVSNRLMKIVDMKSRLAEIERTQLAARREVGKSRTNHLHRSLILRWRVLSLHSAMNYLASISSELLLFPLFSIAIRMQAQSSSFRFPLTYDGVSNCINMEGSALFSGFTTCFVSIFPELFTAGVSYATFIVAIELTPSKYRYSVFDRLLALMEDGVIH